MLIRTAHRVAFLLALLVAWPNRGHGDDRRAANFLPATTLAFVEVTQPEKLLDFLLEHPLRKKIEALPQIRAALSSQKFLQFQVIVELVESQMGIPWRSILTQATGGSLSLAFDPKTNGVALIAQAVDETTVPKLIESISKLARLNGSSKGKKDALKSVEFRGIKVYTLDKAKLAVVGKWMMVTNNHELGKQIMDAYLDQLQSSLASNQDFVAAKGLVPGDANAWAYLNIASLRATPKFAKVSQGPKDNPLVELLMGGLFTTVTHAPYATLGLNISSDGLVLQAAAPHDPSWLDSSREYFFGAGGAGVAPANLLTKNSVLSLGLYRDIAKMWLYADDLFNQQINDDLAKADSTLSTLFSGKDFGEDILGALQPELRLVVTRQNYAAGKPIPKIKLPAFGIATELKNPAAMQPELRRMFQNLLGFLNITGAMNGQPQLELDMEKTESMQLVTSSFLADSNSSDGADGRIHHNFSPSIAFVGSRFVIASTKDLAVELANATEQPNNVSTQPANDTASGEAGQPKGMKPNTDLVINLRNVRETLADNAEQLVAQNMLQEGHTKQEAEEAVRTLLDVIGWFETMSLRLNVFSNQIQMTARIATLQDAR